MKHNEEHLETLKDIAYKSRDYCSALKKFGEDIEDMAVDNDCKVVVLALITSAINKLFKLPELLLIMAEMIYLKSAEKDKWLDEVMKDLNK